VIVATGGIPTIPDIPGIDNPKVIGTAKLLDELSSLMKRIGPKAKPGPEAKFLGPVGQKVVIIGGQYLGVNMAEFLVKMGKVVTIVDEEKEDLSDTTTVYPTALPAWVLKSNFGKGITPQVRIRVRHYLESMNVRIELGVKYEKITHAGLIIKTGNGETETIPADIIIVALPFTANTKLADSLKGRVPEVYAIGDCQDPGVIAGAVTSANLTARRI
jgi:NADPH-dependent 2,4-dienoyl-CoA reductase/sulfur reductase-like enzyme